MAVQDWSAVADENTTIDGIDIAEHCPAKNINDAIRSVMASVKKNDASVVHTAGAETIDGAKTFTQGPYGATVAMAAADVDLSQGSVFTVTISAATTLTFSNVPAGKAATFNLIITNGGAATVTWPTSVKWASGTAPTLTASGVDVLTFLTPDGGTTWYGTVAVAAAA